MFSGTFRFDRNEDSRKKHIQITDVNVSLD